MSRIQILNFGPIKDGNHANEGWIDLAKVTIFIGNQGSGKSTVAKLISTFSWMEKALIRGDFSQKELERKNKLKSKFLVYHRLEEYLKDNTSISYEGDAYCINYSRGFLQISENTASNGRYALPQIMYVPAERNFLSYLKKAREIKLSSAALQEFLVEFDNAKNNMKGALKLPLNNNTQLEYHKLTDTLYIKGDDYRIKLGDASSGYQSLVPLNIVSDYLANRVKRTASEKDEPMTLDEMNRFRKSIGQIIANNSLTEEQRRIAISELSNKFNKTAFINIVEEPEQNLFPTSQQGTLYALLSANNLSGANKLVITTHSPYTINYLSIAIQAGQLTEKIEQAYNDQSHTITLSDAPRNQLQSRVNAIVPKSAMLRATDLHVYELNETDGTISRLGDYDGIPSDENYLNRSLRAGNELFDKLLEIEEEL
ncbi:ATP-binding protein [Niabella sp. CC-SYL272]|uniref:ATP-binding protein n=1 Tax=Niabella agricola TaxID=2891571 RepID=UPI001F1CD810|nr:ATP-binding protein [Niabella agricola]MCF3109572.1 ATP-binding protein [Niabella agricola]